MSPSRLLVPLVSTVLLTAGCSGAVESSSPPPTSVTRPATPVSGTAPPSSTSPLTPSSAPSSAPASTPGSAATAPTTSNSGGSDGSGSGGSGASTGSGSGGSASGASAGSGSGAATSSGSGNSRSSVSGAASTGNRCTTADLRASVRRDPGGGAAGATYDTISLTNISSRTCITRGFGGVSYVGHGDGTQIGAAATRTDQSTHRVTLAPGQHAEQQLRETRAGAYPTSRCRPTHVDGLRIYPPDQTASLYTAHPTTGCANRAVKLLQIGPLHAA